MNQPALKSLETTRAARPRYQVYTLRNWRQLPQVAALPRERREAIETVATVLPFRVDSYVVEQLIDWNNIPDDPLFQLTFPQPGMLEEEDFRRVADLRRRRADPARLAAVVREIREKLNPHPAGQMELNRPRDEDGEVINGLQHKYRETVLFFPKAGQVCHSYCTFCFRWAQFVGEEDFKMAVDDTARLHAYLRSHREVTDLLLTGGDPMVMSARRLREYLAPLTGAEYEHVQTVRIGTKALTFWPYRFTTDKDADELLRLIERLGRAGKHVAVMAHFNHHQELGTGVVEHAIRRLRDAGAEIRTQGPLLNHINDDPEVWATMWTRQVRLGLIPYYMFVERDTGAKNYFEVPLARAWEIYRDGIQATSGLGRTARGPSMSAGPGKVEIQGVTEIRGEKLFVLRFIQGRNPDWVQRPFFARYNPRATWLNHLEPAFGEEKFFFQDEYDAICARAGRFLENKSLV